jgi:cellobiose-specific phosphotransferase system component IIA
MTSLDSLMLDAKQAILDAHHERFLALQREGRSEEALRQFRLILSCANDVLNESLELLARILASQQDGEPPASSTS